MLLNLRRFLFSIPLSGSRPSHRNFHMFQNSLSWKLDVAPIQILGDIITAK